MPELKPITLNISQFNPSLSRIWVIGAAVLLASAACAHAEDAAVEVTVYFKAGDAHWESAQKVVDDVAKKYPRVHVTKINTATESGAQSLREYEQKYNVSEHGDLTVVVNNIVLVSSGDKRVVETSFERAINRIIAGPASIKGRVTVDIPKYAVEMFGKGALAYIRVDANEEEELVFFRVKVADKTVGWIVSAYHHIKCPICTDTQFLAAISVPALALIDIRPVRQIEVRGVDPGAAVVAQFLGQFKNRLAKDGNKDVDVLSGATKTSSAYQDLVNNLLKEVRKRE
jgi:hypothetical protein